MDVYQIVTERIIELLELGTVPWRKPWATAQGLPKNLVSNKEYRGVNVFLLGCQQYGSPYWLTYKQAQDKGGFVKQGQKSSLVVFWKFPEKGGTGGTEETGGTVAGNVTPVPPATHDNQTLQKPAPILKYYHLFNIEQCEGITSPPSDTPTYQFTPIEKAEQIITGYKDRPDISYGSNMACYSPVTDSVRMPHDYRFEKSEEFFSVLYHELAHSTGHQSRLGRKEVMEHHEFGSYDYGFEELTAELCASMLCGVTGISNSTIELSASYIDGWLNLIKKDKKLIIMASAQAQKAADYILGIKPAYEDL